MIIGQWSKGNISFATKKNISRSIASSDESQNSILKSSERLETENIDELSKFRNNIWNKIIKTSEFENFNANEYFHWLEIYKNSSDILSNTVPIGIEQKMALVETINSILIASQSFHEKKLSTERVEPNAFKLPKLQKNLNLFDLNSKLTRKSLEDFSSDLLFVLKNPPISLLEYFTSNKTNKINQKIIKMIQEDILLIGLRGIIERISEKDNNTSIEKAGRITKQLFESKSWRLSKSSYDLLWVKRLNVPDDLLQNIFMNGLNVHNQELISYLKKHNMVDHYEQFRSTYKSIVFSLSVYFIYDNYRNDKKTKDSLSLENSYKVIAEAISLNADKLTKEKMVNDLKAEQLKMILENFKKKYKEDPSPDKYNELYDRVFSQSFVGIPN